MLSIARDHIPTVSVQMHYASKRVQELEMANKTPPAPRLLRISKLSLLLYQTLTFFAIVPGVFDIYTIYIMSICLNPESDICEHIWWPPS